MSINIPLKPFKFNTSRLIDLCDEITDCHHSTPNWTEQGKLVIRNFNIKNGKLILSNCYFTDESTYIERISRSKPEPGDLIITREAPMGEVCIIPRSVECCLGQRLVLIKPNKYKVDNLYLLYALQSEFVQRQIQKSNNTGSIVSNLRIPVLKVLKIPDFGKKREFQIASVLSALDAKIELNNRINRELEAMAKTLYDYWFVQFDFPITREQAMAMGKPELAGKPYKRSGGPMVYHRALKREIPEGWEAGELQDIANITMGQSPPGESYNEEGFGTVFYQGCTDFGNRFPSNRKYTTQPTRFAKIGDILLSVRAPVGAMNVANEDCCIGRGLAALNSKDNCMGYLDGVLHNMKQVFERRNTDGTTFGSITKGDLFSLPVIKPDKSILHEFDNIVNPMFKKQNIIGSENQQLASLRDWLLPMLMNGQVRVKEAGDMVHGLGLEAEVETGCGM